MAKTAQGGVKLYFCGAIVRVYFASTYGQFPTFWTSGLQDVSSAAPGQILGDNIYNGTI